MAWRKREEILHAGERAAQERFAPAGGWPERALNRMFGTEFDARSARFVESCSFFFIATANDAGHCDASFRSTERGADGEWQPAVRVLDRSTLVFPDYSGNNLFNSLGNLLVNPHIGMLFLDFEGALRVRVNGRAEIVEDREGFGGAWSTAQRFIRVTPEQIYGNCSRRIPRLRQVDGSEG